MLLKDEGSDLTVELTKRPCLLLGNGMLDSLYQVRLLSALRSGEYKQKGQPSSVLTDV